MSSYQQEQLFGYILDALDDNERESLERRLIREPDLRDELAAARRRLQPLREAVVEFEPPPGLADRTCNYVAEERGPRLATLPSEAPRFSYEDVSQPMPTIGLGGCEDTEADALELLQPRKSLHHLGLLPTPLSTDRQRSSRMSEERSSGDWISRYRLVDVATAVTVVMLAAMLIFPAVSESRFDARVLACGEKLRDLGVSLTQYSRGHDGYFPKIPGDGKLSTTGMYAPMLADAGLIHDASRLTCPGNAQPISHTVMRLPTMDQLQEMSEDELADIRPDLGGDFGYNIGYTENGQYHGTKNLGRTHFALMSDSPTGVSETGISSNTTIASPNHDARGQNILFEDGHVAFLTTPTAIGHSDHFFTNDAGLITPGLHRDDSVIGSSETWVLQ